MPQHRRLAHALLMATALASVGFAARAQPVKIAIMGDQSGPYADNGGPGSVLAATMAIEDFGKTVLGRPIELLVGDDQNKPDIGLAMARKWLTEDKVDAILTFTISPTALAVQPLMTEAHKPHLIAGTGSADLTGKACSPMAINFVYDTYAMPKAIARSLVAAGKDSWYFITVDYAFGAAMEAAATQFVKEAGGKVLGTAKHPLGTTDFSTQLLQAQASGAKVIGLANAGADTVNTIKQAREFGIKQTLGGLLVFLSDVHALGLDVCQGLVLTESFYWDLNDRTRAFSERFKAKAPSKRPTMVQAGTYAAVTHYLKVAQAMGVAQAKADGAATIARLKATPTDDDCFGKGSIRADGRKIHPSYLFEVKKPAESKYPWDYYKLLATTPAEDAFRPLNAGGCALVKA